VSPGAKFAFVGGPMFASRDNPGAALAALNAQEMGTPVRSELYRKCAAVGEAFRVQQPQSKGEARAIALDCGVTAEVADALADAFEAFARPKPEGDSLVAVLQMFKFPQD